MNYQRIYDQLCHRAKSEYNLGLRVKKPASDKTRIYYEGHHIIPACLGGKGHAYQWDHENICPLTAKEHFLAHLLLVKIHPNHKSIINALWGMCNQNRYGKRFLVSSRVYEFARLAFIESISGDNHFNKRQENRTKLIWSEERRVSQSKKAKGRKLSNETIQKMKDLWTEERRLKHANNNPANTPSALLRRKESMMGSKNWKATKVYQYTLDYVFVKEYECIADALRELGSSLGIAAASRGKSKTAGGYIWSKKPIIKE